MLPGHRCYILCEVAIPIGQGNQKGIRIEVHASSHIQCFSGHPSRLKVQTLKGSASIVGSSGTFTTDKRQIRNIPEKVDLALGDVQQAGSHKA